MTKGNKNGRLILFRYEDIWSFRNVQLLLLIQILKSNGILKINGPLTTY